MNWVDSLTVAVVGSTSTCALATAAAASQVAAATEAIRSLLTRGRCLVRASSMAT